MSEGVVFLAGIAFLLVGIFINCIIATSFEKIAKDKGYADAPVLAMCFFLGIIGCIYVAAMPKLTAEEIEAKKKGKKTTNGETDKTTQVYQKAIRMMVEANESNSVESYQDALELFYTIQDFENTNECIAHCQKRIKEIEKQD